MNFDIQKTISNFVESQFPQFYLTEGPNFVLFVKAYYEWLESEGQAVNQARSLLDYRDIDNTLNAFLEHFQTKYLYGIPFDVIVNPRFLLKHILDVYRSKGTINCYKLLFKLIYDQDIDVYLPRNDILKPSDNHWIQPKYIEVTDTGVLGTYVGKNIIGLTSGTTAVVESFIKEPINKNIISSLFLTNIQPQGGSFKIGEKIVIQGQQSNGVAISVSPSVIGSLNSLNIINGGQNFKVGDILKVVHRDLSNNAVVSHGVNGLVKVTELATGIGSLTFDILNGGYGYTENAEVFVYRGAGDTTGQGGSFNIGSLASTQSIVYNTDLIVDYINTSINASQFNFPTAPTANNGSTIATALKYADAVFGSIASLTNIKTGNSYTNSATVFVRSFQTSNVITGSVTYNTASNNVTFSTANAQYFFSANDGIFIQANSSLSGTIEYGIVKNVVNSSVVTLWGPPSNNSTPSAKARLAPAIFASEFAPTDPIAHTADGSIDGLNAVISAAASSSGLIVANVVSVNSGKGYVDNEFVELYLSGGLASIEILNGGSGYSNGDSLIFVGGGSFVSYASGNVGVGSSVALTIDPATTTSGSYSPGDFVFQNVSSSSNTANGQIFFVNSSLMIVNTYSGVFSQGLVYDHNVSGLHSNVTSLQYTNGIITSVTLTSNGSGYDSSPIIYIKSANGSGASLTATVSTYNTNSQVTGRVKKSGVGIQPGYWATTQSFLNSDKYVQDSYFYQDFSYQIRTAATLDKYKNILYNTFHTAGSELFGQFQLSDYNNAVPVIKLQENAMEINNVISYYLTTDLTTITADESINTADQIYVSI